MNRLGFQSWRLKGLLGASVACTGILSSPFLFHDLNQSVPRVHAQSVNQHIRFSGDFPKIFKEFATISSPESSEQFMSLADFVVAITPSSAKKLLTDHQKQHLRQKMLSKKGLQWIDCSGDGKISFPEFIFVLTLLSVPPSDFQLLFSMFDVNQDGTVDEKEFEELMGMVRRKSGLESDGHSESTEVIMKMLFQSTWGKRSLSFEQFRAFLNEFHLEIIQLQFFMYDSEEKGSISMQNFLQLIFSHCDHVNPEKISSSEYGEIQVSLQEWVDFNKVLQEIHRIQKAIHLFTDGSDSVSLEEFQRACFAVCGIRIRKELVRGIFFAFSGIGKDGENPVVTASAFFNALEKTFSRFHVHANKTQDLSQLCACLNNCVFT